MKILRSSLKKFCEFQPRLLNGTRRSGFRGPRRSKMWSFGFIDSLVMRKDYFRSLSQKKIKNRDIKLELKKPSFHAINFKARSSSTEIESFFFLTIRRAIRSIPSFISSRRRGRRIKKVFTFVLHPFMISRMVICWWFVIAIRRLYIASGRTERP